MKKKNKGLKPKGLSKNAKLQLQLLAMLLPAFLIILIFNYIPMYGITIAFKDVNIGQSLWGGTWVGLKHFRRLFNSAMFGTIMRNTIVVTLITHFVLWPLPIILAILIHNSNSKRIRKFSQTATYMPHLLSMVVIVSVINLFCNGESGLLNIIRQQMGLENINFLGKEEYFLPIYFISEVWATIGSSAVIYIAALSNVDSQLIEAAMIDGASKIKRIWYIDLPTIMPTVIVLLIMNMGSMLKVGYEKFILLQNDLNMGVSEVLSTYIYKTGLIGGQYSFSAAVNLFQNAIGLVLVLVANKIAKKAADISLF